MAELTSWLPRGFWRDIVPSSLTIEGIARRTSSYWPPSWTLGMDALNATPMKIWDWVVSTETFQLFVAAFLVALFAYVSFHPCLKIIMRRPLRIYVGMEFVDFNISVIKLSLTFTKIELLPVESPILRGLFSSLFPSAIVQRYESSDEYPASKLSIEKLKVGLRMRRSVVATHDGHAGTMKTLSRWSNTLWNAMLQRPILSIKLVGVILEVEKAYIAPHPPPEIHTTAHDSLPFAVSASDNAGPEIPTYDQDCVLDFLRVDEVRDAEGVTFWMDRWIQHATKDLKKFGVNTDAAKERTDDEKMNAHIQSILRALFHSFSIQLTDAAIIIAGAGSDFVKTTRKQHGPRDTNLILAKLPKRRRALTAIGSDSITISFSPDTQCNLQLCLVGAHVKVGNPLPGAMNATKASTSEITYAWHTIAHPFDLVIELKGIVSLLTWALNYDHQWISRILALDISASEIAVSLSPTHLQTALLHLDDFVDPLSSFNEWYTWLEKSHQQRLTIGPDEDEKRRYCRNYARVKGEIIYDDDSFGTGVGNERRQSYFGRRQSEAEEMKEIESRMTRYGIMSLRCIAMKNGWRIPKENDEFEQFLSTSRSSICAEGDESRATSLDVLSPFQRLHQTPLHALATLVREKNAFLAGGITITFFTPLLQYDFPNEPFVVDPPKERSTQRAVPSSLTLSDLSFELERTNPLFPTISDNTDMPRPLLSLSVQSCGMEWGVVDTKNTKKLDTPAFLNQSFVGIMYKRRRTPSSTKVLHTNMKIAVAPTRNQDPLVSIDLRSSDLVIIVNPIPIISAIQILIDFSDLPFRPPDETPKDLHKGNEAPSTLIVNASIAKTSILFMTDRRQISRGIIDLEINEFTVKFRSIGMSGDLAISSVPIALHAGQIIHYPSLSDNDGIEWRIMPYKPIIVADGVHILTTTHHSTPAGKEKESRTKPDLDSSQASTLRIDVEIGTDLFVVNVSPSTLLALIGFSSSLDPFLEWAGGDAEEEERIRLEKEGDLEEEKLANQYRREALWAVFNSVDVDESGTLQEEELERIVLMLYASQIVNGVVNGAQRLTRDELKRERDHLVSIIDSSHSNQVSYREVDTVLFRMAHAISDVNLTPKIGLTGVDYLDGIGHSTAFLSAPTMRKLVYFDDLREYAAMHQVYRITGRVRLENGWTFPAPSLWHQGDGIGLFWNLYTRDTGCTSNSLNGQDIYSVQRKLVRSLCNYQFAKFCWKTLVQPQLHAACNGTEGRNEHPLTCWLLDTDPQGRIGESVIDRLLRHVDQISRDTKEAQQKGKKPRDTHYKISLVVAVDSAVARFGSSHTFTNPLFEARCSQVSLHASALLSSQTWWFVPELKGEDIMVPEAEPEESNEVHFRSTFSVYYLNMKHDHLECFIEPYPCFGHLAYKTFLDKNMKYYGEDPETTSFTVNINCPRSLNINALPAFFGAATMMAKIGSQLDPEAYRLMIAARDIQFIQNLWNERDQKKSGFLRRDESLEVLHLAADNWKDELIGLTSDERDDLIISFCGLDKKDDNEQISFDSIKQSFEKKSSRCLFAGCHEIQLTNATGRLIKVASAGSELYQTVDADNTAAIPLGNFQTTHQSQLSLSIERYKSIRGVAVSPYQSLMLPLIRHRRRPGRKLSGASGFSPHLTVVPKPGSLDSITLTVRPCVTIRSEIPIRIRIVRLTKALGYLKKKGSKSQIDLTKKSLLAALIRLVEGALIVYEKDEINEGAEAPLPLNLLDSTHYHALLIQDLTGQSNGTWRDPVLLTKDFLFNPMNIREVSRCHALSGVCIQKERLNICLPEKNKHSNSPVASDAIRSILKRTAWDTTIEVVPFFLLSNSMPFPILARTWQFPRKDDDTMWRDPALLTPQTDDANEESSSDEDTSAVTPSIRGRGANPDQFHLSRSGRKGYFSLDSIPRGETLRLSGIHLRQPLFIQVSQRLEVSSEEDESDFMWSKPLKIKLAKLRTGINQKGAFSLPRIPLNLGDNCSALVDVSIERGIRMPICTIYSPFWIMNKTGSKMEYKVKVSRSKSKRYLDSGSGGLPVMLHCGNSDDREISVIPLESPSLTVANNWWDASSNGTLVLKRHAIKNKVEWSERFALDTAGTSDEVQCKQFIFSVSIESLAGAFYRSNLITLAPRFVLKNMLHIPISVIPICGSKHDAMRKASQLREALTELDERTKLSLGSNESTILYNFRDVSIAKGIEKSYRWAAFRVNSARKGAEFKCKWHIIPIKFGSTHFGEHDGFNDTMCGIIEAKVHGSDGARVVSITHATVPPFRIENRSNDHYLQFVQDNDDAVVFELPPMHSCGYTWDFPHGKTSLRVVVVPAKGKGHISEEAVGDKTCEGIPSDDTSRKSNDSCDRSIDSDIRDDESFDDESAKGILNGGTKSNTTKSVDSSRLSSTMSHFSLNQTSQRLGWKGRRLFGTKSRSYSMSKVGSKKSLPCQSSFAHFSWDENPLKVHLRISAGTKILSFNDSNWLIEQVELGLLRKGGDFQSSYCDIKIDGLSFYLLDDYPQELMGVIVRDIQIYKPMGKIQATAKVRHFQVDAMLPNVRYPIIIQPSPLGVDRHGHLHHNALHDTRPASVDESDCFWHKRNEGEPILEVAFSYVPQSNMTWVPECNIFVCPLKLQLDVDYILRVVGMVINSISKYDQGHGSTKLTTTTRANSQLQYITYGQLESRLTYVEKLYIAPVWFEFEINIKPDEIDHSESEAAGEAALTLNSIARSTNSAAVAGVLSWVINVGANFAHVSPTFRYGSVVYEDRYCDILDLARNIAISYIVQSIKQSYKVVFSMHLLGDPSLLLHQWRTGVSDLVFRTRDELAAGGKDGFGKGIASFSDHALGGSCKAIGKITGGFAKTIDSLITNDLTSNHLKPKLATDQRKSPRHAIDGLVQGTKFLSMTVVHGTAGLLGDPYRGAKSGLTITGSMAGFTKGFVTGVAGLLVSPIIGTLGFLANTSDGIGATARYLELGAIEARCRPARMVPWGRPMSDNGLSYLKAIGIRVHTVRYQKIRKRVVQKDDTAHNDDDNDNVSSREFKRRKAAEQRRKNPPNKVVNIMYKKENRQYVTTAIKPKLLTDRPASHASSQDHYAVCFEDTLILESSNLQLGDEVVIQFRNSKTTNKTPLQSKPSGACTLTVGDIYYSILHFHGEQLKDLEINLSEEIINQHRSTETLVTNTRSQSAIIIPAPQEYSLFRPAKGKVFAGDIFEAIGEEMEYIQEAEVEALNALDSDSVQSDSDSSFLFGVSGKKAKDEDGSKILKGNERLFGSVSLSFFPVLW